MTTTLEEMIHSVLRARALPSVEIQNIVSQREALLERYRRVIELLREIHDLAAKAHFGAVSMEFCTRSGAHVLLLSPVAVRELTQQINAGAWARLLRDSGIRALMDGKTRQLWDAQIANGDVPTVTRQGMEETFREMQDARAKMFKRRVIECFEHLSWDYKKNQPVKFGKRIVMTHFCSYLGSGEFRSTLVDLRVRDELGDLLWVLSVLDGKPQPDHREGFWRSIDQAVRDGHRECENEYLHLRWYENGNAHLTFKRPDLIERMNDVLAKHFPYASAGATGRSR